MAERQIQGKWFWVERNGELRMTKCELSRSRCINLNCNQGEKRYSCCSFFMTQKSTCTSTQTCANWSSSICLMASSSSTLCLSTVFSLRTSSLRRADTSLSLSASWYCSCSTSDLCCCWDNSCFNESDWSCMMVCSCRLSLDNRPALMPGDIISKLPWGSLFSSKELITSCHLVLDTSCPVPRVDSHVKRLGCS